MDKTTMSWWAAHKPTTRRLAQLYSALLYNAHLKGFITGQIYQGKGKYLCVPGFNCYSCPGAAGACPLGSLQNALASAGHRAGWYVIGILLLFGITLGRTICGWFCPLGMIQELLHKIPTLKIKKSILTRVLSWLKYILLGVFVVALPLIYGLRYDLPLPAFCKYICPAGTLEGAMGLLSNPGNASFFGMLGILFTRKFVIMLVIALACILCYRSFCRFICPLGALYSLFNRFSIVGVRVDESRCNHCGACVSGCGMDVQKVGDKECIHCGHCMDLCHQGAISLKAGNITLKAPHPGKDEGTTSTGRNLPRLLWGIALLGLCFALLWFNVLDPAVKKEVLPKTTAAEETTAETEVAAVEETEEVEETEIEAEEETTSAPEAQLTFESTAPVGYEVGEQLGDFTLSCYDGSKFHLADQRGKVVLINLWATYCTPCKQELPYLNDLYLAHGSDLALLEVHPSLVVDDPEEYLADKGYAMPFATDEDDTVLNLVGGSGTYPQTIVLNPRGEVVYNEVGSVTPEILDALYEKAWEGMDRSDMVDEAEENSTANTATASSLITTAFDSTAPSLITTTFESTAPVGYEVGEQLGDFTLSCYDGSKFHLADQRGKMVLINFWATYCTPCKQELPYLNDLYLAHSSDLALLEVHPSLVVDDPEEYLADKGYAMPFATDEDDTVLNLVGGTGTYPQTIVLNPRGEVVYNDVGSVTPKILDALYEKAWE